MSPKHIESPRRDEDSMEVEGYGLQDLALVTVIGHLVFHRWSSWRATILLMVALTIAAVESLMIFVCGSWYAFIYTGPLVPNADRCEMMTGLQVSRALAFSLATLTAIILPQVWSKRWGTLR